MATPRRSTVRSTRRSLRCRTTRSSIPATTISSAESAPSGRRKRATRASAAAGASTSSSRSWTGSTCRGRNGWTSPSPPTVDAARSRARNGGSGLNPMVEVAPDQARKQRNIVAEHIPHLAKHAFADLRPFRGFLVPVDDLAPDLEHLLNRRARLADAFSQHLKVLAVEQPQGSPRRALHQPVHPGNAAVLGRGVALELRSIIVGQLEELEQAPILPCRVVVEVVENGHMTAITPDHRKEALEMLSELAGFPIVEEARFYAAARDRTAFPSGRNQRPGAIEPPLALVAIVEQPLVQRRDHLQRIADADDELRPRPQPQDRLKPLGRIEIADRPFGQQRGAVPVGEEQVEVSAPYGVAQPIGGLAAQVVAQEEMRLLRRRKADLRMSAEIFGQRGRSATRRPDDERPARGLVQT